MKALLSLLAAWSFAVCAAQSEDLLKLVATVPLPGVTGRFDHFAIDADGQRLFVAALGNNTVEVISVVNKERVTTIRNLRKPTGVAYIPYKNQVGVAAGDDGVLKVFSGEDYKLIETVSGLDDADNVRFDKAKQKVFVGYGDGALAIIDANTWKKSGDIKLSGHPESFQLRDGGHDIYVNVPTAKHVAVIDGEKRVVSKTFPTGKFQSNFPMALDEANNRLFIGCRRPARLLVLDTPTGQPIADLEISGDTDDLFYDARRGRIYVSCGEGFIDVIAANSRAAMKRVQKLPTRAGARTSFYSHDLDRFFLAVPSHGSEPAEIRIYQPPQP
jgi:hypothetical protein